MKDVKPLTRLLRKHGVSSTELVECMGSRETSYSRIAESFEKGSMTLRRLVRIADCIGIPAHTLVAYYVAMHGYTEQEESDEVTLFVLESMRRRDEDLAFAYYLELHERGKVTPPIQAWANAYLSSAS